MKTKIFAWIFCVCFFSINGWAAGKPAPTPPTCGGDSTLKTPRPVRPVVVTAVGTKVFSLPNGSTVDIGADLATLMTTSVSESPVFAPTDGAFDSCQNHLEIRAAVSTLQMNVVDAGISFGYTPSGSLGPVTGINGKAHVKVGTISMDFSVWNCTQTRCTAVGASYANQLVAGADLTFDIDFGEIKTGPSLVFNTPLGKILRVLMQNGMAQLAALPRVNELPWTARVMEYLPEVGAVIFDAGTQMRINPNETFEVYAPIDASETGGCRVFQVVAYAHTVSVNSASSTALIDQVLSSRGVQPRDIVMIRALK